MDNKTLDDMRESLRRTQLEYEKETIEIAVTENTVEAIRNLSDRAILLLALAGNYGLLEARNRKPFVDQVRDNIYDSLGFKKD